LLNLLLTELGKQGLEPVDLLDKPFDPNLAEAVAHEPGDGSEVIVAEVLRSGYTWRSRTLRPAMVRTKD
jgi:molecular chaperone GrpE